MYYYVLKYITGAFKNDAMYRKKPLYSPSEYGMQGHLIYFSGRELTYESKNMSM
jgi:hypothetical protein